jgi:hypothetical protein
MFTDVWRCEVSNAGIPPVYSFNIRTMPTTTCPQEGLARSVTKFDWPKTARLKVKAPSS